MKRREVFMGAGAAIAAFGTLRTFPAIAQNRPLKIGAFVSEHDASGVDELVAPYMSQMQLGVQLALSEINGAGGIFGRSLEVFYVNDLGSPASKSSVQDMLKEQGVEAIISGFVQASPRLITLHSAATPVPVLAGFWTDGAYCGPTAKHFAPTARQIVPAIRGALREDALGRPFTIANWTPSGRAVSQFLYGALEGAHVGDALVTTPVTGSHAGEFRGVLRWADEMDARTIWVAEPRPYAVNVVNQAVELDLARGKTFAYLDFSEIQAAQLAPGASVTTCLPFVASDQDASVRAFVSRVNAMPKGEIVTHVAFTHYNAVMALKAAMEVSGEASAEAAIAGFARGLTLDTPTGPLTIGSDGYATMNLFVAQASGGGQLEIVQKLEQVAPAATC